MKEDLTSPMLVLFSFYLLNKAYNFSETFRRWIGRIADFGIDDSAVIDE